MPRIKTQFTFGYKATNDEGVTTIDLEPTTLTIDDQSNEAASAHLVSVLTGLLGPANVQASRVSAGDES